MHGLVSATPSAKNQKNTDCDISFCSDKQPAKCHHKMLNYSMLMEV